MGEESSGGPPGRGAPLGGTVSPRATDAKMFEVEHAGDHTGHAHRAAVGLDDFMPHDLGRRVRAAFDQHVGANARSRRCGVSSSNTTTYCTLASAANMAARSVSPMTGRDGPLSLRTLVSLLTATNITSPSAAASERYVTWATCSRSKQPLVNTTLSPRRRCSSASSRRLFERHDFARPAASARQQLGANLIAIDHRDSRTLDFQSRGYVAQPHRVGRFDPRRQAQPEHRHHHVAGASDVVNRPRVGRKELAGAVPLHEHHAVAIERDQRHLPSSSWHS